MVLSLLNDATVGGWVVPAEAVTNVFVAAVPVVGSWIQGDAFPGREDDPSDQLTR